MTHHSGQPTITPAKSRIDIAFEEFDHINNNIYPAEIGLIETYFKEILEDILSGETGD